MYAINFTGMQSQGLFLFIEDLLRHAETIQRRRYAAIDCGLHQYFLHVAFADADVRRCAQIDLYFFGPPERSQYAKIDECACPPIEAWPTP